MFIERCAEGSNISSAETFLRAHLECPAATFARRVDGDGIAAVHRRCTDGACQRRRRALNLPARLGHFLRRLHVRSSKSADDQPPSQYADSHIIGWVDGVSDGRVLGWVFSTLSPRRRLTILVQEGGATVARQTADLYRADVDRAFECSDGYCGFSISVARLPRRPLWLAVEEFDLEISGASIDLSGLSANSQDRIAAPASRSG